MKKLILAAFALTTAVSVFAQGSVVWQSYSGPTGLQTQHIWGPSTTNPGLSLIGNASNDGPVGTTPYAADGMLLIGQYGTNGVTGQYGARVTFAQLLYANGLAADPSALQPGGQTTTFHTGTTVGRIVNLTETITGLVPDSSGALFEMVAWDNSSGQYATWTTASVAWQLGEIAAGEGGAFTVAAIGGTVNTQPIFVPPNSFNLYMVPEPASFALAGLGAAALLIFRRRK